MKIIKKMKLSLICIIVLLLFIFTDFPEVSAGEWLVVASCNWDLGIKDAYTETKDRYNRTKNHYNSLERLIIHSDTEKFLSNLWQNLTVEYNRVLQKDKDFENYCSKLKAKAAPTIAEHEKFYSMCGGDNPNDSCDSWWIELRVEMDKRQSEYHAFMGKYKPHTNRAKKLVQDLKEFTETLDWARCDAVKKEYSWYKNSFETWENMKKPLQEKINILRKKIAETAEFPGRDYSAQDLAECESLAYQMIGSGESGGVHCRIWDDSDWAQKNPIMGGYKVDKYYLEVRLIRFDKEAKRISDGWQGKYINYRFGASFPCPGLEKLEKLY